MLNKKPSIVVIYIGINDVWHSQNGKGTPKDEFESGLKAGTGEIYVHEIPGGQYSNLRPQARGLGLEEKFEIIKENYTDPSALKKWVTPEEVADAAIYLASDASSAITGDRIKVDAGRL